MSLAGWKEQEVVGGKIKLEANGQGLNVKPQGMTLIPRALEGHGLAVQAQEEEQADGLPFSHPPSPVCPAWSPRRGPQSSLTSPPPRVAPGSCRWTSSALASRTSRAL